MDQRELWTDIGIQQADLNLRSYLALFAISFARFIAPEVATKQADTIIRDLCSFSLTVEPSNDGADRWTYSNFNTSVMAIFAGFEVIEDFILRSNEESAG